MTFADKLRELREAKGWSQKALAEKSGQPQQSIANWEQGLRAPLFEAVQSLCKALGESCVVFDGCEFGSAETKPGRGRPKKEETPAAPAATPAKPAKKKKKT